MNQGQGHSSKFKVQSDLYTNQKPSTSGDFFIQHGHCQNDSVDKRLVSIIL